MRTRLLALLLSLPVFPCVARTDDLALVWSRTFSSPGNYADEALGLAVNPSGSLLVAGYRTGPGGADWWMLRLDEEGGLAWSRTLDGATGLDDIAYGVAADASGGWMVAGKSNTVFEQDNWEALFLDREGNTLGSTTWNSPIGGADVARGICAIPGGDYAIVGSEARADLSEGLNWRVRRYCSCGALAWTATLDGSASGNDEANAVAVDSSGNLFVAGYEDTGAGSGGYDARLVKYSPAGEVLWSRSVAYHYPIDDFFSGVAVDSSGNVVAVGRQDRTNDGGQGWNWIVVKYGSSGSLLWATEYDNPSLGDCWPLSPVPTVYGDDQARAVAVDARGNVIVAGGEKRLTSCTDGTSLRYWDWLLRIWSPDGLLLTSTTYDGPIGGDDFASAVSADPYGNIYVAGYCTDSPAEGGKNLVVRRYSRAGWPARPGPVIVVPPVETPVEGISLDRNVFRPGRGETLSIRAAPVNDKELRASVYTASGRFVRDLRAFQAGSNGESVTSWDGRDADGAPASRGVFLVRIRGGGVDGTLKVLIK